MSRVPTRFTRGAVRGFASSPAVAGFRPAGAALAIAAAFSLHPLAVRAQPAGAQAIHGQATVTANGNNLLVTTRNGAGSNHSAINWQSFSVPGGSTTWFNQPSVTSTSINRVLGPDPSAIFGTLGSNGKLVLVNPAGIAVGRGAVVDTAGFTASTLALSEADALAGRLRFAGSGGPLQVDGRVVARSGDVVLIAPQLNTGAEAVVESNGATVLAAGQKVEITGRGLEGIRLEVQAPGDEAVNLGRLQGDAVGIFAGTLRHSGLVVAQAVSAEGGKVVLRAAGDNLVNGTVAAAGTGGQGGSIDVLGQRVGLLAGATLRASGDAGGGQVRVGGDYQGANAAVPNALRTYVDAQARIEADAGQSGNGGRVIVWSDEATRFHGQISARGGAAGGDGGFAEVSGKQYLEFTGRADLRAPNGRIGTLLLDPTDIEIHGSGPTETSQGSIFAGSGGTARINVNDLNTQLDSSNVKVTTNTGSVAPLGGQITLFGDAHINWSESPTTLTLEANNGIQLNGDITGGNAGSRLYLTSLAGNIQQDPGTSVISMPAMIAEAQQGQVLLNGNNMVGTLAGKAFGPGARFEFTNAQALTIGTVTVGLPPPPVPTPAPASVTVAGIDVHNGINPGVVVVRTRLGSLTVAPMAHIDSDTLTLVTEGAGADLVIHNVNLDAHSGVLTLDSAQDVKVGTTVPVGANANTNLTGGSKVVINARNAVFGANSSGSFSSFVRVQAGGGAGGGVSIDVTGDASFTAATEIRGWQSPITVDANGSILGSGVFVTDGSVDGSVTLTATNGSLSYGSVDTSHSSGSFSTIPGGKIMLEARTDITGGDLDSWAGDGGVGGEVKVLSHQGLIDIGDVDSSGAAGGGNITLEAHGDLTAEGVESIAWNEGRGGTIKVTSATGNIRLDWVSASSASGGMGGTIELKALAGSVGVDEDIRSDGGYSDSGTAGAGGEITILAKTSIEVGDVVANGGWSGVTAGSGAGGMGGKIVLQATEGSISADDLEANGGYGFVSGADGGRIDVTATGGNIDLHSASAAGGPAFYGAGTGGAGGKVTLVSNGGNLTISGGVNGMGGYGGPGGRGGDLYLQASGDVMLGQAEASGGDGGGFAAGNGGQGGTVYVRSGGDLVLNPDEGEPAIRASGGSSYHEGTGGDGGTITLVLGGGLVNDPVEPPAPSPSPSPASPPPPPPAAAPASLEARGGDSAGSANAGGRGGTINVEHTGDLVLDVSLPLDASGGAGGSAMSESGASGAAGGAGGRVVLKSPTRVILNSPDIRAEGGPGGHGDDTGADGPTGALGELMTVDPPEVDVNGSFELRAIWINDATVNIGDGTFVGGDEAVIRNTGTFRLNGTSIVYPGGGFENLIGGAVQALSGEVAVNLVENQGSVSVAGGALLAAPFFLSNNGLVTIDGTLHVATDCSECATSASSFGGPFFTNNSGGTLAGSGSLVVAGGTGTVDNFGTIAPGGIGSVGSLTLASNLTMEGGSLLKVDIESPSSHDFLRVNGATELPQQSTIEVNAPPGSFGPDNVFPVLQSGSLGTVVTPVAVPPPFRAEVRETNVVLVVPPAPPPPPGSPPPPPPPPGNLPADPNNPMLEFLRLFDQLQQAEEDEARRNGFGRDDICRR